VSGGGAMSGAETAPRASLWLAAAAAALAIHVGGAALALASLSPEEPDDALGAPAIEIGIELMAPRAEPTDLPVGPETEASAPSPPVVEQKAEVKPTELPTDRPTETEDPDRLVATHDSQKPKAEEQDVTASQTAPSAESAAAVAMAPPSSETARESTQSVAPVQGIGQSDQRARMTWVKEFNAHIDRHLRWPSDRVHGQAHPVVAFVLDRTGHILSASIAQSSGDASFDNAALAMVRRSDPVPAPPALVADEGLTFTKRVDFVPRGRK
jgi:periplasmic protein TonB